MNKQEAIQELLKYDHCVMSSKGAEKICDPFNVPIPKEVEYPDAQQENGKPVIGIAAHELAEHLCQRLGISYISQFGKGSQLRMCCKALTETLT